MNIKNNMLTKYIVKIKYTVVLMLGILMSFTVYAVGGLDSGGGNAVVCFSDPAIVQRLRYSQQDLAKYISNKDIKKITSVEMLEFYETKQKIDFNTGTKNSMIPLLDNETPYEYSKRLVNRYLFAFPFLYEKMIPAIEAINASGATAVPQGLEPVNDFSLLENGKILSKHDEKTCVITTIAKQTVDNDDKYTELLVDGRIFDLPKTIFSPWNRAILFLHEAAIRQGARKTNYGDPIQDIGDRARNLSRLLLSKTSTVESAMQVFNQLSIQNSLVDGKLTVHQVFGRGPLDTSTEVSLLYYYIEQLNGRNFSATVGILDQCDTDIKSYKINCIVKELQKKVAENFNIVFNASPVPQTCLNQIEAKLMQNIKNNSGANGKKIYHFDPVPNVLGDSHPERMFISVMNILSKEDAPCFPTTILPYDKNENTKIINNSQGEENNSLARDNTNASKAN